MARYADAVDWLAGNDDNGWLDDPDEDGEVMPSVAAALVADVWDKPLQQVVRDLRRALQR
jgi:hypothetical protein